MLRISRSADQTPVEVVVVPGGIGAAVPLLLLLLAKIKIPSPMTTPAPTSQSTGGFESFPCACLTPAAGAAGSGPVSADIAGNGAIIRAALTTVEMSVLFTLCSPSWVILLRSLPLRDNTVKREDGHSHNKINMTLNEARNNYFRRELQKRPVRHNRNASAATNQQPSLPMRFAALQLPQKT